MEKVLDKGYVRLISFMGSDIDIVNAARVSFDKEILELSSKDEMLIQYLVKNKHDSCFRHCALTFEVYAPLMVARQWYKHAVASSHVDDQLGWNETSRRYVTENEQFYIPSIDEWRSAPENKKQGSGDAVDQQIGGKYTKRLSDMIKMSMQLYKDALADGIAPEQARIFLPAYSLYIRWRWTTSLNALMNFLSLRTNTGQTGAQKEIAEYANAIRKLSEPIYPVTMEAWREYR